MKRSRKEKVVAKAEAARGLSAGAVPDGAQPQWRLLSGQTFFILSCLAIAVIAGILLFNRLDDRLLWGDEAETALLAINITKYGIPKACDGKNCVTLRNGEDLNRDGTWVWSPWMDEYIAAFSFIVLGASTFSARLPFALIAFLTIPLLGWVTHRITRDREQSLMAMFFLVANVPFLLHARQCRYYAIIMAAQVVFVYGFHRLLEGKGKGGTALIVAAATAQFYNNYIVMPGNFIAFFAASFILRKKHPRLVRQCLMSGLFTGLLALPWVFCAMPWDQLAATGLSTARESRNIGFYGMSIHYFVIPLVVLLIPPLLSAARKFGWISQNSGGLSRDTLVFLLLLPAAHVIAPASAPGQFFRYVTPLIPVAAMMTAMIASDALGPRRFARWMVVAILSLTNVVAVATAVPFGKTLPAAVPLISYIREITSDYRDRQEDVTAFLAANGSPGQSVWVFDPEFPLIFYTGMKVIDGRYKRSLPPNDLPDWILSESASGVMPHTPVKLPEALRVHYETISLAVHDTPRNAGRPDPTVHQFKTTDRMTTLVIYKKKES